MEEHSHIYNQDAFNLIREVIYQYSGMYFSDDYEKILLKRLEKRLDFHNLSSFHDYYNFLKYHKDHDQELKTIMDLITIRETYFFREDGQLKALVDEVILEIFREKPNDTPVRIWCAGCASGEEPYSMAMLIREQELDQRGFKIEIFANDISQEAIQKAKIGEYGKSSFRSMPSYYVEKYFALKGDKYLVNSEVKNFLNFFCMNLMDRNKLTFLPLFDVIFCRNVLIYFNKESKKEVITRFHNLLIEKGTLFLGHSESLMDFTDLFKLRHFKNALGYEKVG
jgi:chemotaxis protein methyltransferase CheR